MTGLATGVVRGITEQIVGGELRPGDRLPTEARLSQDHGVSRTVVREAMSQLRASGLVESVRGRGSFVLARPAGHGRGPAPRTAEEVRELWELRLALEVAIVGWAARRRTAVDLDRLRRAADRFAEAVRPADALEADRAFHRSLAAASGNSRFVVALDELGPAMVMMPPERLRSATAEQDRQRHAVVVAEHGEIVAAVAEQDADLAAATVRRHLVRSRQRLDQR